jgi:hypothetical protein
MTADFQDKAMVNRLVNAIKVQPLRFKTLAEMFPAKAKSGYLTYVLHRLRIDGVLCWSRGEHDFFSWRYVPVGTSNPAKDKNERVVLKHTGAYRVRTRDGRQFDRLEFDRINLTWHNAKTTLQLSEVDSVSFTPDHARFKSGAKHLSVHSGKFVKVDDCILPKRNASSANSPSWINPIRGAALGIAVVPPSLPQGNDWSLDMDFSDPRRGRR